MDTTSSLHPAEAIEPYVRSAEGRANVAAVAMALTWATTAASQAACAWLTSSWTPGAAADATGASLTTDQVVAGLAVVVTTTASMVAALASCVFFLYWLHRALSAARMLGAKLRWSNSDAIASFFIPALNIVRPFEVLRDLHSALPADALPEPAPAAVRHEQPLGYREAAAAPGSDAPSLSPSTIKAWWGCYLASSFAVIAAGRDYTQNSTLRGLSLVFSALSLVFALWTMRGINALLRARYRRVRGATAEALASADVILRAPSA